MRMQWSVCKNRSCILFSSIQCKQQQQPISISIWNSEKKEMTNRDIVNEEMRGKIYAGANNIQQPEWVMISWWEIV